MTSQELDDQIEGGVVSVGCKECSNKVEIEGEAELEIICLLDQQTSPRSTDEIEEAKD